MIRVPLILRNASTLYIHSHTPIASSDTDLDQIAEKADTFLDLTRIMLERSKEREKNLVTKVTDGALIFPKRTGVIGTKLFMTQMYDQEGVAHPVTLVHVDNTVIQVKHNCNPKTPYVNLQLGAHPEKIKNSTLPMLGHFAKHGVRPFKTLEEFKVHPDEVLETGTTIGADHYVPGHFVDVTGITKGKGFSGAMKRWGFGGGRASHGASKSHRSLGSTGNSQDPGKVWKGKKMAGKMGNKRRVQRKLLVLRVDRQHNLLWVRGCFPGASGSTLFIKDYKPSQRPPEEIPDVPVLQAAFHYETPDFLQRKKTFLQTILPGYSSDTGLFEAEAEAEPLP